MENIPKAVNIVCFWESAGEACDGDFWLSRLPRRSNTGHDCFAVHINHLVITKIVVLDHSCQSRAAGCADRDDGTGLSNLRLHHVFDVSENII